MAVRLFSKGNLCALGKVTAMGALRPVVPLLNIVRNITGFEDKERGDETFYINSEQNRHMKELREQFEKEVKAIYKGQMPQM